jgi:glycosyltransferase involved in cell wall biosynthesis
MLRALHQIAADLSIEERVHLISATYADMPQIYNAADVFMMLSKIEAFGSVYAEAAACGLPTIGLDVGGVSDAILHGSTGFVVSDENEAAEALQVLIEDSAFRARMGRAGRRWVENSFATTTITAQLSRTLLTAATLTGEFLR